MGEESQKLKKKLEHLLQENQRLRRKIKNLQPQEIENSSKKSGDPGRCSTVSVPEIFRPVFVKAQEYVRDYFADKVEKPEEGTIDIHDERYILVRAASMSKEFFETIYSHYEDRGREAARRVANGFLFDLAHSLGKADAKSFHSKMKVKDPIEKLSAGPVHFAYSGWAFVKILPESNPTPDENYYLIYDHPFSFEADVWMKEKIKTDFPVCIMNCGYSSGWCEESFGIPLVAVELECRARGDNQCRFIMAQPSKIEQYIQDYQAQPYKQSFQESPVEIPEFFQRKRLEDELSRSEETARALMNAPTESALLLDLDGKILAINRTSAERLKKPENELIGTNIFDLFKGRLKQKRKEYHQQVIKTGMPVEYIDKRDKYLLDNRIYPVLDSKGKVRCVAVYSQDISELKKNEMELKKHRNHLEELVSEKTKDLRRANVMLTKEIDERKRIETDLQNEKERLAVTLTSIAEGLVVTNTEGRIVMFNQAAEELSGWTEKEVQSRLIDDVFPIRDLPDSPSRKISLFSFASKGVDTVKTKEGTFSDRSNNKKIVHFSASPIRHKTATVIGYIFVLRDITKTKIVEEESLRYRKIESLGLMAGGIAHDFNNLLTGILGNISILKHESEKSSFAYQRLEACELASINAKKLTAQLLTFSRGGEPVKKTVLPDKFLKDTVDFSLSGSSIKANFKFSTGIWPMEIDEGLMGQAIGNLVLNAVQSMPAEGFIDVQLENFYDSAGVYSRHRRKYVKIFLKDNGPGISKEDLSRIFDPYYTTKDSKSGMGLTIAYSIIKKHEGEIWIDSNLGNGTSVTVLLPAKIGITPVYGDDQADKKKKCFGKILLMDDEELVRDVAKEMLQLLGFSVVAVENGKQAVREYKKAMGSRDPFRLVIMDLTVPGGMGGQEATRILRRLDSRAKVIVSSGYSNDPVMSDFKNYGFSGVVAKPYRIEEMRKVLEEALEG